MDSHLERLSASLRTAYCFEFIYGNYKLHERDSIRYHVGLLHFAFMSILKEDKMDRLTGTATYTGSFNRSEL